jgi:hypothetical protein
LGQRSNPSASGKDEQQKQSSFHGTNLQHSASKVSPAATS